MVYQVKYKHTFNTAQRSMSLWCLCQWRACMQLCLSVGIHRWATHCARHASSPFVTTIFTTILKHCYYFAINCCSWHPLIVNSENCQVFTRFFPLLAVKNFRRVFISRIATISQWQHPSTFNHALEWWWWGNPRSAYTLLLFTVCLRYFPISKSSADAAGIQQSSFKL